MPTLRELVAQVSTAYFSNVSVSAGDIPTVMTAIAQSLRAVEDSAAAGEPAASEPQPAPSRAAVEGSITPDALISFEDGRPYKTLRRHLAARGLTPAQYRAKYNLPADYPMVAPNTSAARSRLARSIGLGGPRRAAPPPEEPPAPPPRRGRPRGGKRS